MTKLNLRLLKAANLASSTRGSKHYYINSVFVGVFVDITAAHTTYVATNGHILFATRELADEPNTLLGQWTIPSDVLAGMKLKKARATDIDALTLKKRGDTPLEFELIDAFGTLTFCKMIDGTFLDWRRVIGSPDGFAGNYNVHYLMVMSKIGDILENAKGSHFNLTQDAKGPGHVSWTGHPEALGIIMPSRGGYATVPTWLTKWRLGP
jgi:hypothetical protein